MKKESNKPQKKTQPKSKPRVRRTMPEMRCFLACETIGKISSIVRPGGDKSVISGIFEAIWTAGVPTIFSPVSLFIQLWGGSGEHMVSVIAEDEKGNRLMEVAPTPLTLHDGYNEISIHVGMIQILEFGDINFTVSLNGTTVGWPLIVRVNKISENK